MSTRRTSSAPEPASERQASLFHWFRRPACNVSQTGIVSLEREISHTMLRNAARAREAAAQMGNRYIGHPANHVQRIA